MEFYQNLKVTYIRSGELSAFAYEKVHSKICQKKPKAVKFYEQPKQDTATSSKSIGPAKQTSSKNLESLKGLELLEALQDFIVEDDTTDGNVTVFSPAETTVEIIEQILYKEKSSLLTSIKQFYVTQSTSVFGYNI